MWFIQQRDRDLLFPAQLPGEDVQTLPRGGGETEGSCSTTDHTGLPGGMRGGLVPGCIWQALG